MGGWGDEEKIVNCQLTMNTFRVGVAGPVGSGKTALVDALCKALREQYNLAVVTNDIDRARAGIHRQLEHITEQSSTTGSLDLDAL